MTDSNNDEDLVLKPTFPVSLTCFHKFSPVRHRTQSNGCYDVGRYSHVSDQEFDQEQWR